MATSEQEPIIDVLEQVWASTFEATEGLDEADWARPSELPGWTVKDCLSHVATVESNFLGEPTESVPVSHLAHVIDPVPGGHGGRGRGLAAAARRGGRGPASATSTPGGWPSCGR